MGWLAGWKYRQKITVPANLIDADLPNALVPVYFNGSNFDFTKAKDNGHDMRFTDASGNLLKFERCWHYPTHMQIATSTTGTDNLEYYKSGLVNTSKTTVIEASISKVESSGSDAGQMIYVTNGTKGAYMAVKTDGVICNFIGTSPYTYAVDMTKSRTIRIELQGTTEARFYLDGTLIHTAAYANLYAISGNYIAFGDPSSTANRGGKALWKYFKYNIDYVGAPTDFVTWQASDGLPTGWTIAGTSSLATIYTASGKYNVQHPLLTDSTDTDIYAYCGNSNAYNASIESWQDMTGKALTYNGNVCMKPNVAKFGKCAYFDGTTDYVEVGTTSDFKFLHSVGTSGTWTIDFWYQTLSLSTTQYIFDNIMGLTANVGLSIFLRTTGVMTVQLSAGGNNVIDFNTGSNFITADGKKHHIEITYDQSLASNNIKVFLDGILNCQGNKSAVTPSTANATYVAKIGGSANASTTTNGYIDEFRISDTVRHTADFIPSQTPYTADQYTKLLMHFDDFDAMRIATSTTSTDYCGFKKDSVVDSAKTTVMEAVVAVESNGSTRGQCLLIYNGAKLASMSLQTDKAVCNSYGTNPYNYSLTATNEHTYRIELQGTTEARFYVDGTLVHTATYANLMTTTTNQLGFGDGDAGANMGGSAVWKSLKYNLDYGTTPNNFIEWIPTLGMPSANGWTAYGTTTLAGLTFYKDATGKKMSTYGDTKPIKTAYADNARGAYFDGSGDYFSLADSSDFWFGTSDMCIEWDGVFNALPASGTYHPMYNQYASGGTTLLLRNTSGTYTFEFSSNTSSYLAIIGTFTPVVGTRYKIKVYRTGNTFRMFINDVQYGGDVTWTGSFNDSTSPFTIGGYDVSGSPKYFNGYMLGMRITKGRSRSAESQPDKLIVDGNDVVLCTNFDTVYDQNYAMVQHMGDTLVDATGNGNNGTATGTTVVDTAYGKARSFNGSSDFIQLGNVGNADKITLTALYDRTLTNTADQFIIGKGYTSVANPYYQYALEDTYNAGRYGSTYCTINGVGYQPTTSPTTFLANVWRAMTGKFDGSQVSLYENDNWYRVSISGVMSQYATNACIGKNPLASSAYFGGIIAETRVSTIARSDAWIKAESLGLKNSLVTISGITTEPKGSLFYGTGF